MKSKLLVLVVLILGILLSGCATGLTPSSWPGFTADATRAYVAAGAYVYAVDLRDGTELWRFPEKGSIAKPFYAAPVLTPDGSQLIVGGYDHILYSLNPETGKIIWQFEGAKNRYISSVLVADDLIYAPNADYILYTLNMKGELKWHFKADQPIWAAPITDGKNVYFGALDRKVYALNINTGVKVWEMVLDGAILGSPVIEPNGLLYVGTYGGTLYALSLASGEIRWSVKSSGWIWSGPAFDGTNLYFGDSNGKFYSLTAATGSENWSKQPDGPVLGTPLLVRDQVIFGAESGTVYALDYTGTTVWNKSLSGMLYGPAISVGNLILLAPAEGDSPLVALDQNGIQQWAFTPAK